MITCKLCGNEMQITEEDSRQEWHETTYGCDCGFTIVERIEFDALGRVPNVSYEEVK